MAVTRTRGKRPSLPGTLEPQEDEIAAMIRVDHAGEFGALCIYQGQLAVLTQNSRATANTAAISRMAEQERVHFAAFDRMVKERGVRPTALEPLWQAAGYAMGAATALMGEKAAMACTVAVEDVIDEHYANQIERLGETEPDLKQTIAKFQQDELDHRNDALSRGASETPAYPLLTAAIRLSCRIAISLSQRL